MSDNKGVKLQSIEEIALRYLKNREAKNTMKMDHSILNRLNNKGGKKNGK